MKKRNGSNAMLTELLIVVLFFALIAVIILQMFVGTNQKSKENMRTQQGQVLAQSYMERLFGAENIETALQEEGFLFIDNQSYARTDEEKELLLVVKLGTGVDSQLGSLTETTFTVWDATKGLVGTNPENWEQEKLLISLPLTYYRPNWEVQQ